MMIEYLSGVATILLLLLTFRKLGVNINEIAEDLGSFNHIWGFLGNFKRWSDFYDNLNANDQTLRQKLELLNGRQKDVKSRANIEASQNAGSNIMREVEHWLSSAEKKVKEIQDLLKRTDERVSNNFLKFVYRAWLGNLVEIKIREVDDLRNSGNFEVVLSISNVPLSLPLPLPSLVKDALNEKINTIITWLVDTSTKIIGVHGIEGIGKTTLISCLYNLLIEQYEDEYDTIILILEKDENECKSKNETELRLQEQIANELKINLEQANNDLRRRAAVLHRVLSKKKFVLILDGLTKPISEPTTIGIPLGENGKMIITSRYSDVCRKTGCSTDKTIGMLPLSADDAFKLFKEKVKVDFVSNPDLEPLANKLVERCGYVPSKIVDIAGELRGEHDISNWNDRLLTE